MISISAKEEKMNYFAKHDISDEDEYASLDIGDDQCKVLEEEIHSLTAAHTAAKAELAAATQKIHSMTAAHAASLSS